MERQHRIRKIRSCFSGWLIIKFAFNSWEPPIGHHRQSGGKTPQTGPTSVKVNDWFMAGSITSGVSIPRFNRVK